jgi:hypothetical protein
MLQDKELGNAFEKTPLGCVKRSRQAAIPASAHDEGFPAGNHHSERHFP